MLVIFLFCYSNSHDFRRSFGGSISITAQCIETQLMPNEGSGKDLQIMYWSLLRQISPSWRNLRHKVSTSVTVFLLWFFLLLLARKCQTGSIFLRKFSEDTGEKILMKLHMYTYGWGIQCFAKYCWLSLMILICTVHFDLYSHYLSHPFSWLRLR